MARRRSPRRSGSLGPLPTRSPLGALGIVLLGAVLFGLVAVALIVLSGSIGPGSAADPTRTRGAATGNAATAARTATPRPGATTTPRRSGAARPSAAPATRPPAAPPGMPLVRERDLPPEARQTIALIRAGGPFPYERDGVMFQNREGLLPAEARGYYREYTVRTPGREDRGPRRIVAGRQGELYYTADHYESFRFVIPDG